METETQSPAPVPEYPQPVAKPSVFGTKIPASVTYVIGVLLFLLPFIEIRCNNMSLQTVNGLELATGFHVKTPGSGNSLFDSLPKSTETDDKKPQAEEKKDPNIYALLALALGVIGLALSFSNARAGMAGAIATGVLAAGSLIGLMLDLNNEMKTGSLGKSDSISVSIEFTQWFYITIIAFLAAAFLSYKRMQLTAKSGNTHPA